MQADAGGRLLQHFPVELLLQRRHQVVGAGSVCKRSSTSLSPVPLPWGGDSLGLDEVAPGVAGQRPQPAAKLFDWIVGERPHRVGQFDQHDLGDVLDVGVLAAGPDGTSRG